jgi:hypothetical protein
VIENLRKLQGEMSDTRRKMRDGFAQVNVELSAVGQQLAGLTTAVYAGRDRVIDLERRIELIERRLELRDADH